MKSITYILYKEDINYCILIDCGEYTSLRPVLDEIGKNVKAVLLTHGHFDHIFGLVDLIKDFPSLVIYTTVDGHKELSDQKKNLSLYQDCPFIITNYKKGVIGHGEHLFFKSLGDIEVISTPGHDSSCLSYIIKDALFTGDAYIPGVKVFSKLPRGNKELALASREKLIKLENDGYHVYCGHYV